MRVRNVFVLLIITVFLLLLFASGNVVARAQTADTPDFGNTIQKLPPPVSDFFRSVSEIGKDVTEKKTVQEIRRFNPIEFFKDFWSDVGEFFKKANGWFLTITGTTIPGAVKAIANFFLWLLGALINLVKWFVSLIP